MVPQPSRWRNTACGQKSRFRDSRRRFGDRCEKQQHWLVGWRSDEHDLAGGRHDRCARKSAKDRRSQLGVDHSINAKGFVLSFVGWGYPFMMQEILYAD